MDITKNKVQVLMSTYNGEKYLREQLDSILQQDYTNITLLIRDDGSSDSTLSILKEYSSKYSDVEYYQGDNIGSANSFFDLICKSDTRSDYFAFSDQDDVWKNNKISHAIEVLLALNNDEPLLYCSKPLIVDEKLCTIEQEIKSINIRPSFGNAIVENVCTGCTSLLNRELVQEIKENVPEYTIMHDWWAYLVASYFGQVYYDQDSYVLYRQHLDNVVGSRTTYVDEFKTRCKNYKKNRGKISRQLAEFYRIYHEEVKDDEFLKTIVNYKEYMHYRFKVILSNKVHRQRKIDNIIFKLFFLWGKI